MVRGGLPDAAVEVVPPGIDFSAFEGVEPRDFLRREFGFAPEDYLIGAVVHLEDDRGHRTLIEAAKILRAHAPKSRIIILGEGSLRLEIDDQGAAPHVKGLVYYLGRRADSPKMLASLDLFVVSSHLDGLGGLLLEAMASRLPVVAAQAGNIPDVVIHRETGLLVPPRDAKALADAILKLTLDRNLAARLAAGGYDSVHQTYSAEAMARKIVALYERLASRKGVKLA
jgi:glycosyltransferase involved in cell wall biosynthesis